MLKPLGGGVWPYPPCVEASWRGIWPYPPVSASWRGVYGHLPVVLTAQLGRRIFLPRQDLIPQRFSRPLGWGHMAALPPPCVDASWWRYTIPFVVKQPYLPSVETSWRSIWPYPKGVHSHIPLVLTAQLGRRIFLPSQDLIPHRAVKVFFEVNPRSWVVIQSI